MRRVLAIVGLIFVARPALAQFIDQPITGVKLQLKQSSSGKEKLLFQSKYGSFPFPLIGSADDPRTAGATIEIITPGVLADDFVAPQNSIQPGWTVGYGAGGVAQSYKYKRDKAFTATTPIKSVGMRSGKGISILGDATGIPLDGARGTVGIRITVGSARSCARFTGAAVTKDAPGVFVAKGATTDGLVDCTVTSLTGQPPTCGDGDVNQPSESCDTTCTDFPDDLTCRPPGASNECTCCSDGWPAAAPCCNPSSILVVYPPQQKLCFATRCDPPDACQPGDTCQADNSCCSVAGGNLCVMAYAPPFSFKMIPLNECCPGLECGRYVSMQGFGCCASGGTSCSSNADCCTRHCQIGGTCESCRTGGTSCATGEECCSLSCNGGTCDACAPPGEICGSGATCCSGTCTNFQCQ